MLFKRRNRETLFSVFGESAICSNGYMNMMIKFARKITSIHAMCLSFSFLEGTTIINIQSSSSKLIYE